MYRIAAAVAWLGVSMLTGYTASVFLELTGRQTFFAVVVCVGVYLLILNGLSGRFSAGDGHGSSDQPPSPSSILPAVRQPVALVSQRSALSRSAFSLQAVLEHEGQALSSDEALAWLDELLLVQQKRDH